MKLPTYQLVPNNGQQSYDSEQTLHYHLDEIKQHMQDNPFWYQWEIYKLNADLTIKVIGKNFTLDPNGNITTHQKKSSLAIK